ncbi:MAG: M1 family metallopeptidase [Pelolinea sp.]|nr:M1 family metallopeptidase [Pelolinea sp.]
MKIKYLLFLILVCLMPFSACTLIKNKPADNIKFHLPNNLLEQYRSDLGELQQASVYRIVMTIDLIEDVVRVEGTEEVIYTNQESIPLESIYFRLFPNVGGDYLSVSEIQIDGIPMRPIMEYSNTALRLELEKPLPPGESTTILMHFDEVVPSVMGGNYGLYVYLDDILALDAFFPIIPVYNDEGWNVEEPPQNADMIFTDVAFFSVTVDAPEDLVLVAGGKETRRVVESNRQVVTYKGGPQRDFYLAASPNFVSENITANGVKVTSYFFEEYRSSGERVLEIGADALMVFSERFGPYPYDELDLVSTPMQAGGMEYSNIVVLGIKFYDPASTTGETPGSVFLNAATAHEVGHQWFYGQVMNDQIDEPWMDESLVQYVTYLYYLDTYGEQAADGFKASLDQRWARVNKEPIPIGLPAKDYTPTEYSAIVYGRGALFFDALSDEMDQDNFDAFLREYVETHRWGIVEPRDMKRIAEEACDCNLSQVFYKWGAIN